MTKEEAIKHLLTYLSTNGSGQTTQEQHEEAKRMAIKALKAQQWIPCSERLPEKYRYVLTTYTIHPWRSKKPKRFVNMAEWMGDGWKSPIDEYLVRDEAAKIRYLAWCPLPEPWRGEEHEQDD